MIAVLTPMKPKKTEVVRHLSRKKPLTSEFVSQYLPCPFYHCFNIKLFGIHINFFDPDLSKPVELVTIDMKTLKTRSRQRTREPRAAL